MPSLVILGANGFLGRAILEQKNFHLPVKAVARNVPSDERLFEKGITWYKADLLIPSALDHIVEKGDIVINLAYIKVADAADNLKMIDNIVEACLRYGARRLIHCSTAAVTGRAANACVDETTTCLPVTKYEYSKFAVEQRVLNINLSALDWAILRPTAIVGVGGENLLKLIDSLINGSRVINYLRACLFGRRNMHLVPVRNVAAAMAHLVTQQNTLNGHIYIVSSDSDPENNFRDVEAMLLRALKLKPRKIPVLQLPLLCLSILLKFRGRSESNLIRVYDSKKILATHFIPVDSVYDAVNQLGKQFICKKIVTGNLRVDKA